MSGRASFTRLAKEEMARSSEGGPCCVAAEAAALVRMAGTFHIRGGEGDERYGVHISTSVQAAAKRVYSYFKGMGAEAELLVRRERRFQCRLMYEVHLAGTITNLQVLNELGILSDSFRLESGIPRRFLRRSCCRSAFLRGCFMGAASVNDPLRDAHLEFVTPHAAFADDLVALLAQMGFRPGTYARRSAYVVYLKGREEVAGLLALAGAHQAALALQEGAVLKEVRAQANRVANCDQANLRRSSRAAQKQLDAIDFLERVGQLRVLSPALQEAAELRRAFPYLGLAELAEEGEVGLTRMAVNHRLRRLVQAARDAGFSPYQGGGRDESPEGVNRRRAS